MASGSFTGTTNNDKIQPKITWSAKPNTAGNYSDVTVTLSYSRTNSGYTTSGRFSGSITIDGTKTVDELVSSESPIKITQNSNTFAMRATKRVYHNAAGDKKITISATGSLSSSSLTATYISSEVTLDTIQRTATLTSAPNFDDEVYPVITYSNPAGNAVTKLMACISLTGAKDDVKYRDIEKTGTSYKFKLSDAERKLLRESTDITKTSRKVRFYVRTTFGSTHYYSNKEVDFTINETSTTKPTVELNVALNNDSLPDKFDNMYIQNKSRLDVTFSAEGKFKATISDFHAIVDGKKYSKSPFTSDVIKASGDVVVNATDSRGFTNSASKPITVIEYSKPLVVPLSSENAILCYRSDENGVKVGNSTSVWIKAKRNYYSVEDKNQCALRWRSKEPSEEWNDSVHSWKDLIPKTDTTTSEYDALISGEVFDTKKSYTVQIMAIDDIGEYDIKTIDIPTEDVALHLGKGGKNVTVGGYCDYSKEHTFRSVWDAYFDEEVYIKGQKLEEYILNLIGN